MDKLNQILGVLREKVKVFFDKDATGHSIDHLERTLNYALKLQKKEGGDVIVVGVSAFIHDIHRILGSQQKRFVSPKESLPIVEDFIKDLNLTNQQKQHILHAVEHHEEYSFSDDGVSVTDIESLILQDADNLDAIGAIGISRAIKYSAAHGIPDFDVDIPLIQGVYDESKDDPSTVHHIHNKLLRLGENMNTKTAKKLAKKKNKIMKDFRDLFIEEVAGENYAVKKS